MDVWASRHALNLEIFWPRPWWRIPMQHGIYSQNFGDLETWTMNTQNYHMFKGVTFFQITIFGIYVWVSRVHIFIRRVFHQQSGCSAHVSACLQFLLNLRVALVFNHSSTNSIYQLSPRAIFRYRNHLFHKHSVWQILKNPPASRCSPRNFGTSDPKSPKTSSFNGKSKKWLGWPWIHPLRWIRTSWCPRFRWFTS